MNITKSLEEISKSDCYEVDTKNKNFKPPPLNIIDPNIKIIYFHIPKTAGTTITFELTAKKLAFNNIHLCVEQTAFKINIERLLNSNLIDNHEILVSLRNPIDTFISHWYWLMIYKDIGLGHKNQCVLSYSDNKSTIQDYIESMKKLNKDFEYYNKLCHYYNIIDYTIKSNAEKKKFICFPSIGNDLKVLYDIDLDLHLKNQNRDAIHLKIDDYSFLKNCLKKDYDAIKDLYLQKYISFEQYNELMKDNIELTKD